MVSIIKASIRVSISVRIRINTMVSIIKAIIRVSISVRIRINIMVSIIKASIRVSITVRIRINIMVSIIKNFKTIMMKILFVRYAKSLTDWPIFAPTFFENLNFLFFKLSTPRSHIHYNNIEM